jgi:GT2 family glycosyltransferase
MFRTRNISTCGAMRGTLQSQHNLYALSLEFKRACRMMKYPSSRRKSLVAVVVTHNRLAQLRKTVISLLSEQPEVLRAVVVVDNASCDGTAAWLGEQSDPRLVFQRSEYNIGGAGGFEAGMRLARKKFNPDWTVVMDDDARPLAGALAAFHSAERPDTIATAAAVYYPSGQICEMNRPSVNPFWSLRSFLRTLVRGRDGYHIPYRAYGSQSPCPVDLTSFVGFFISRRMIAAGGLPDPRLFLYGDDVIYTLTLRRLGFGIVFDPSISFEHDCSTFENDRRRVFDPIWKVYYTYRNALIMYRLAAGFLFWVMLPLLAVKWFLAADRYGANRAAYLQLMSAGLRDGVCRRVVRSHEEILTLASPDRVRQVASGI